MPELKWGKPKLIVLVRGNPEEVVLTACKGGRSDGPVHHCIGDKIGPCYDEVHS